MYTTDLNLKYKVLNGLNSIEEQSKVPHVSHHLKQMIYIILEVISYGAFLGLVLLAFIIPTSINVYLGSLYDVQVNVLISSHEWEKMMMLLKMFFLIVSLFPLGVGILIRSLRIRGKKMYTIFKTATELISKLVADGNS